MTPPIPGPLVRRLLAATLLAWLAARVALVAVAATIHLTWPGVLLLVAAVWIVVRLDLRRSDSVLLYANLAISPWHVSALVIAVALILELLVGGPVSSLVPVGDQGTTF